jgi:HSP20 family molecular chaperone IbpA
MGSDDGRRKDVKEPLNNIMKGLEGIFGLVDDLIVSNENFKNISGEVDLLHQNKVKAQYDLSMKLGLDDINSSDRKVIRNLNKQIKMEPNVDIYEEENEFRIIILTSNIEQKDIKIFTKDNQIIFEARNPEVFYYKEITVPSTIDDRIMTWNYKNGVIEITINEKK